MGLHGGLTAQDGKQKRHWVVWRCLHNLQAESNQYQVALDRRHDLLLLHDVKSLCVAWVQEDPAVL